MVRPRNKAQPAQVPRHSYDQLFEASIAELESVGLGKTPRELYLSYLRKMPANLQKEIRSDKRLWPTDQKDPRGSATLRGPKTWEQAHKVVLEYEHREATHSASANSVFTYDQDPPNSAAAEARKELNKLKAEAKKLAKANATAAAKAAGERVRVRRLVSTSGITVVVLRGRIALTMIRSCACRPADRSNASGNASYAASSGAGPQGGGKAKRPRRRLRPNGAKRGRTALDLDTAIGSQYGESLCCVQHPCGQRGDISGGKQPRWEHTAGDS